LECARDWIHNNFTRAPSGTDEARTMVRNGPYEDRKRDYTLGRAQNGQTRYCLHIGKSRSERGRSSTSI
jgi:hypothetical protein